MLKLRTKSVSLHITGHFYFSIRTVKMQDKHPEKRDRTARHCTVLPVIPACTAIYEFFITTLSTTSATCSHASAQRSR